MTEEQRRKSTVISCVVAATVVITLSGIFHHELYQVLSRTFHGELSRENAKDFMRGFSWKGTLVIGFLSFLQVVFAVLPAEPVQVIAGMSYGLAAGVAICIAGIIIANMLIFFVSQDANGRLSRYFSRKLTAELSTDHLASKIAFVVIILYLLPAIPYGLIGFLAASTDMKFRKYILLTTFGALPSVLIGAGLGVIAISQTWIISLIVFAALITILIVLYRKRDAVFAYINKKVAVAAKPYSTSIIVREPSKLLTGISCRTIGVFLTWKAGLHYKRLTKEQRQELDGAVVLCNHPSFVDWAYLGKFLYPLRGNYIVARYYFFNRKLASVIHAAGGFPKSLFSTDFESARNTMRVKKQGRTLCLFPEARLSTVGRTESMQPILSKLIRMMDRPVYVCKLNGAYLAKPKWSDGYRKGARTELSIRRCLSQEEVKTLTEDEIFRRIEQDIQYNDLDWLKERPAQKYSGKNFAKGLENILCVCPECGQRFTMRTDGSDIYCEACRFTLTVNARYEFEPAYRLHNFQEWYDWQSSVIAQSMDDDFQLVDTVRVKRPSLDGKTFFRWAGEGTCRFSKEGFTFKGILDEEQTEWTIPLERLYRVPFGAGENFEVYDGREFFYFVPDDLRKCVLWYITSEILYEKYLGTHQANATSAPVEGSGS